METYALRSMHSISETARGSRGIDWRILRTSKWDWGTVTLSMGYWRGAAKQRVVVKARKKKMVVMVEQGPLPLLLEKSILGCVVCAASSPP